MRIGHGYDVHKLVEGRKLILGGIEIPHHLGLLGHSDADVLLHAICDSILGAAALGDIGIHFPDTDMSIQGIDSCILLEKTISLAHNQGYSINNIDSTIIAQKPKLAPFIPEMKSKICSICNIEPTQLNIKATTTENLGFVGKELGIAAHAVTLLAKSS